MTPPIPLPPRLSTGCFPAYSYVPGMHPHPHSDPAGHSRDRADQPLDPADPTAIRQAHLWAVDLLNYGYYWESHEAWEAVWHAYRGQRAQSDFLKGLIKLAAAGVKARAGSVGGVRRHAHRAAILFGHGANRSQFHSRDEFGMDCLWLQSRSRLLFETAVAVIDSTNCAVKRVLPLVLAPEFQNNPSQSSPGT